MKEDPTDKFLRSTMRRELRPAPDSPWFTRKVVNRLPSSRPTIWRRIEAALYVVAALVTIAILIIDLPSLMQGFVQKQVAPIVTAVTLSSFLALIVASAVLSRIKIFRPM